ncbi:DNA-binding transcriptional ArsR family regulator [Paenibacillus endophyticus]|uniref:DNA-binding transcriptional ArsR family regulator n=1 Tax=Paenibacillus endophyticus TaxID=1294268 RepID=A0A7W5G8N6_9BACL|nr:helix-turn-helix transcriptional regulator [Paenibacillus endophyticus]MBB3151269.1 DNA-binding transcriptional ArsR family regulator [Paenibacillus endophyticus]
MKILFHPNREDIELTSVLYALSDPIRLQLVLSIKKNGEQPCGHFEFPVVKSTMTHHIRTLREAGVLHVRKQGTQHFLTLRADDLSMRFPGLLEAILHAGEL